MKTNNKTFWSMIAVFYNKFIRGKRDSNNVYLNLEKCITDLLNNEMKVLELAAGPGTLSQALIQKCKEIYITDFSENMVNTAKKTIKLDKNIHFEVVDAKNIQYEKDSFDAVVIANALHIMPEPEMAIKEINRVIKPNGIVICPTFIRETKNLKGIELLLNFIVYKKI